MPAAVVLSGCLAKFIQKDWPFLSFFRNKLYFHEIQIMLVRQLHSYVIVKLLSISNNQIN